MPGKPVFHNLTLGYRVLNGESRWVASFVDDLTLQHDLIRSAPPLPGWFRVVSDDRRLLHLILAQTPPDLGLDDVLTPLARLFGTEATAGPGGMTRVEDRYGASIAIAAPLPGERERPCEIVSAPLSSDQERGWEALLAPARHLGFVVPRESATHLHFDGAAFQQPERFAALVELLSRQGERLKSRFGVNPHCRRLGAWPEGLLEVVRAEEFRELTWPQACSRLRRVGLSKYCDFNLLNLLGGHPDLNTLEVRVLPGHLGAGPIVEACAEMVELFREVLS